MQLAGDIGNVSNFGEERFPDQEPLPAIFLTGCKRSEKENRADARNV